MGKVNTNTFTLTGRLTRDAEFRTFGTNGKESKFSIANNRGFGDFAKVNFFDCKIWGKKAESLSQYLTKGLFVSLTGEITQDKWTDNEGNNKSKIIFSANEIEFLSSQKDGASGEAQTPQPVQAQKPSSEDVFDDDIPF